MKRLLLLSMLAFVAPFLTAAPAHAGGNFLYVMSHSEWSDVNEGMTGPTVSDLCGDCYWTWTGYVATHNGNEYHMRYYKPGDGRSAFIEFRMGSDGKWHVGWYKAWSCDNGHSSDVNCAETVHFS